MDFTRVWAMPSADTFDIPPIGELVRRYLRASQISVDPFARNKRWATHTNDLNPDTAAECHVTAAEFLASLRARGMVADLILFDPPFSNQQIKEVYASVGMTTENQSINGWYLEKDICYDLLGPGGYFVHCGWHSNGMGKARGMEIVEGLLVAHGRAHYDTIVTVERKIAHQPALLETP